MPMHQRSRQSLLAAAACIIAIAGITFYVINARRPLSDRATSLVEATLHGDAGALMKYATSREVSTGKLTQVKLQKVLDHLYLPYVASREIASTPATEDDTGDIHGMAIASITRTDGSADSLGWDVYQTEEGSKAPILQQILTISWQLRFAHPDGKN